MQVTETLSEGLKREFAVVVPAAELEAKVNVRLDELKDRVKINGFRPGKVPVAHLKRVYGRSAMAEVIEADRARHQQSDRDRSRLQARRRPEGDVADRAGSGREDHQWRQRSQLHGGGGNRAGDQARQFQGHQADQADGRRQRRRDRRWHQGDCRPEPPLRNQG